MRNVRPSGRCSDPPNLGAVISIHSGGATIALAGRVLNLCDNFLHTAIEWCRFALNVCNEQKEHR